MPQWYITALPISYAIDKPTRFPLLKFKEFVSQSMAISDFSLQISKTFFSSFSDVTNS